MGSEPRAFGQGNGKLTFGEESSVRLGLELYHKTSLELSYPQQTFITRKHDSF
jgi:hypothetical protein